MSTIPIDRPPAIVLPNPGAVPSELKRRPQWVCWRWERRDGKWTKPPINPRTGAYADNTKKSTWTTFEYAVQYARRYDCGVGFVFSESDPYCGIDFDDCRDPETGAIDVSTWEKIAALDSYTEISPSGKGVKVILKGKLPDGRRRKGNIEMYDTGRFFTVTGNRFQGTPETIEERQSEVEMLYREVFGEQQPPSPQRREASSNNTDDDELIGKASNAENGEKFSRLWTGDWSGYPSRSEADLALCSLLAFWTNGDAERVDRLFRRSGLYREKWDERHGDRTYGEITITTALRNFSCGYTGHKEHSLLGFHTTELGNAERLIVRHGDDLRYCARWGKWFVWDGRRWAEDTTDEVRRRAVETIRTFGKQAFDESDTELRKTFVSWALRSESRERIDAMVSLARSFAKVAVRPEDFDADPWLLNVENGTLDLRTGTLREHRRGDLITKLAPVTYEPNAKGKGWRTHIEMFLPNENIRRQVQRDLGVALVGATLEESLPIWYGTGANGKTTTARTIMGILGDYADRAAPNLLIQSKQERHPTELADLCGKRLVFSVEVDQGKQLAEALVKDLTGGDRKKARFMKQDFFKFEQTFSIVLIANHRPIVTGSDPGIWRRINLIPWEYQIDPTQRRPQEEVVSELVEDGSAILNWLLAGLKDWQHDHIWRAPEVQSANAAYRAEMDVLGDFITERCVLGPRCTVPKGELYAAYAQWCKENHETPITKREFGQQIQARGIGERKGAKGVRLFIGIGLLDTQVAQGGATSGYPKENLSCRGYTENAPPNATQSPSVESSPDEGLEPRGEGDFDAICHICGQSAFCCADDGLLYCKDHAPEDQEWHAVPDTS